MSWGEVEYGGVPYDLKHLDPFVVSTEATVGRSNRLLISFGCHTFTREIQAGDPAEYHFIDGKDARCFCPIRYGNSSNLPRIVRASITGRVFFSEGRNLLCIDWLPELAGPYAVYFNMVKAKSADYDATMFVVSAYEKPALPSRLPAITFTTLFSQVVTGKKVVPPKDLRSISR